MGVPQINLEALSATGGKPKDYYILEFFRLYEKFWDIVVQNPDNSLALDAATGLLLGTCPAKERREQLWITYVNLKNNKDEKGNPFPPGTPKKTVLDACVLTAGDLWTYLNETMEFTEEAWGGA